MRPEVMHCDAFWVRFLFTQSRPVLQGLVDSNPNMWGSQAICLRTINLGNVRWIMFEALDYQDSDSKYLKYWNVGLVICRP